MTATPATSSVADLRSQSWFIYSRGTIGGDEEDQTRKLRDAISNLRGNPSEETFNKLVSVLKTFMIRHTKSQRINGSEALALPPSTTSTVMLKMSSHEDKALNHIKSSETSFGKHRMSGIDTFAAERSFCFQMPKVLRNYEQEHRQLFEDIGTGGKTRYVYNPERLTKVIALRRDLINLKKTEPTVRAVVFTQYLDMHKACVRGLKQDGFEVLAFTGSSTTLKKDETIRKFQDTSNGKAAVFVITLRSGNVGITLTAASRVYLLEPSLDPAVEVQAAGRIHRLGQNKPCHVVKFAFKKSYEENVIELHKKILAGKLSIVDGFIPSEAMKILAKGLYHKNGFSCY